MKYLSIWLTILNLALASEFQDGVRGNSTLDSDIRQQEERDSRTHSLSRRKRFLTFPDGSSLQLVLCTQTANIASAGDIFLYGNTAALAWELPSDPTYLNLFKDKQGNFLRRKDDVRNIYYTDDKGKLLFKVPYKKRPIVNPAFAKRSVGSPTVLRHWNYENSKIEQLNITKSIRKDMHASQQERKYLNIEHTNEIAFHRNSRKDLFGKLEVFLKALGMNGRQCLLRILCETGSRKTNDEQGSFMEEMMRVVFTLPKGYQFDSQSHQEYDVAHQMTTNCEKSYPDCSEDFRVGEAYF